MKIFRIDSSLLECLPAVQEDGGLYPCLDKVSGTPVEDGENPSQNPPYCKY
jgi:hypothetical protein